MTRIRQDEKLVLIDTDAGTDDALAIFLAIQAHKNPTVNFKIVGIVCVNGNTSVDNVCNNVTRILQVSEATDIPIFRGCAEPMVIPYSLGVHVTPYHGYNGLGDVDLTPIDPKIEDENGVLAIIRLAKLHQNKLTILALGPLTNLAMAVRLDPSIKTCVKEIYLMGGNIEGVGNTTLNGEFNFVVDPESAYVTLSSFDCPIVIVPWETCRRPGENLKEFRLEMMGKLDTPQMKLLNQVEKKNLDVKPVWFPCDVLAAAVLLEPQVIKGIRDVHATVELSGHFSRGLMVLDHVGVEELVKNVSVIHTTDNEILKKLMLWAVGHSYYK